MNIEESIEESENLSEKENNDIKRKSTNNLNYLCSNFNERTKYKNYNIETKEMSIRMKKENL